MIQARTHHRSLLQRIEDVKRQEGITVELPRNAAPKTFAELYRGSEYSTPPVSVDPARAAESSRPKSFLFAAGGAAISLIALVLLNAA